MKFAWKERRILRKEEGRDGNDEIFKLCVGISLKLILLADSGNRINLIGRKTRSIL